MVFAESVLQGVGDGGHLQENTGTYAMSSMQLTCHSRLPTQAAGPITVAEYMKECLLNPVTVGIVLHWSS